MRDEKKYLIEECSNHLDKSDYLYLTDFAKVTVLETAELRQSLRKQGAEFHVVKNSILKLATSEKNYPELDKHLMGFTAIVVGGKSPAEVAKILIQFHKDKNEKCAIKVGILGDRLMTAAEVKELSQLPSIEILRGQFLGLLNTPAQQMARIVQAVPQAILNVLQAKARRDGE